MSVLRSFRLLVVVCNHGKHRSLSLAYELSNHTNAWLISPPDTQAFGYHVSPDHFLKCVSGRQGQHCAIYLLSPHPLRRIGIVLREFDGCRWAHDHQVDADDYCNLLPGDIVVEILPPNQEVAFGWGYGAIIRGSISFPGCWFPPAFVSDLKCDHIVGTGNLRHELLSFWNTYANSLEVPAKAIAVMNKDLV